MILKIKTHIISSLLLCLLIVSGLGVSSTAIAQDTQVSLTGMLDLPSMELGTQIQIVSPDLTTNFGLASVVDGELILETELEPYDEVRLLISHAGTGEVAMPTAFVSEDGNDLMLHIPDAESVSEFVSFRQWLARERGLRMIFPSIAASN